MQKAGVCLSIISIIIAILIFSAIIIFHELGHFILAKRNHIEVIEFSLGMGPRLLSKQIGETRYSWKLFPIGGSCLMAGEDEDTDEPGSFNAASLPGRFCVVAAGPVFNFILAFLLSLIIVGAIGYTPAIITEVDDGSPAQEAGLLPGDRITSFDGYHINIYEDLSVYLAVVGTPEDLIKMRVRRDGENIALQYQPSYTESYLLGFNRAADDENAPLEVTGLIEGLPMENSGIAVGDIVTAVNKTPIETSGDYDAYLEKHPLSSNEPVEITYEHNGKEHTVEITPQAYRTSELGFSVNVAREKGNLLQTIRYAALEVVYWIRTVILSLRELIFGQYGLNDLSGPIGVVTAIGSTFEASRAEGAFWVLMNMLNMAILLSANLGVMNLLPFPALDGGRLVFIIIEAIIRRPVNRTVEAYINFVGFVLLMLLMVVVMYQDILRLL